MDENLGALELTVRCVVIHWRLVVAAVVVAAGVEEQEEQGGRETECVCVVGSGMP